MDKNNLTGTIPQEIGNLQNLQIVHLSFNKLKGSIPSSIFNISTMNWIALTSNNLSGNLPSTLGLSLPNIIWLYLSINELTGPIPPSICNASKLEILELAHNSFFGSIPECFGTLKYLETLKLAHNLLATKNPFGELSFLSSLTNCQNLVYLWFGHNPLLEGYLPISIGNLSNSLEYFIASDCLIKGEIQENIGNLNSLISLNLGNNLLTGEIPSAIGRLVELQGLFLHGNNLQGFIPNELCYLKSLVNLELTSNNISGLIPYCFNNLTSLRDLFLASNNFIGTIPSTLWRLKDILQVNLSSNSLMGSLSSEIENLKVVVLIDISENELSGQIPTTIGGMQDLIALYLHGNKLQGQIPESIDNLNALEFLDLSRNNLSGMIPKSLEKLLHLKYFNVSFNQLQGEIPDKGPFMNFSFQFFIGNKGLCGLPRLEVATCKNNRNIRASKKLSQNNRNIRASKKLSQLFLRYILPSFIFTVLILVIIIFHRFKRKAKLKDPESFLQLEKWRRISYRELEFATNGFQESNFLGVGSFGKVYKGTLSDGTIIAIKVFNMQLEKGFKSFEKECDVLRNLRHRNLVKVVSSCCNLDFKALVIEFMPNGSLEKWLYSENYFLDILQRLNIMVDVASALEYIHHGCVMPVVHCDIKPSNVLLNEEKVGFVADFGIAKLLGEEDSVKQTITLATIGYMAPEYGSEGLVSMKCDVYSYGILLMETFTRKKRKRFLREETTDELFLARKLSLKQWV
ncbi:receptor kinase-like protein Xa21 [Jatropha curcas]|uniref:receptor kinase-like protein Xa21 n=1 Tax=Jatropha curcas TaxID=180498 RepID=UPI001893232F|nr:receptor kinase-like protein Xa21 [Jatropha curcas]